MGDTVFERPPVLTKTDFVRRYQLGEFGNASPTWDDIDSFISISKDYPFNAAVPGKYHLRNRTAGGATYYNLGWSMCVAKWIDQYEDKKNWYASAMCPHEYNLIQGEVVQGSHVNGSGCAGVDLLYSTVVGKPMRDALKEETLWARGLMATSLLRTAMCPNSYEWLQFLLEAYPGHVVEFTTLSKEWGTIPGYNTIFWEVRNY